MADLNKFVERMRYWCDTANLGYSQSDRWNFNPNGGNCDCSSLVIHALQEAGFDTGSASYTGNMSSELCARGWMRIQSDGNPQVGDICLNDANHVAVCTAPGMLSYASIDEHGHATGGEPGDQTGKETKTAPYYSYPWDCYLRYTGQPTPPAPPTPGGGGTYKCVADVVNIRVAPSLSAEVVDQYHLGQTVILDNDFIDAEGYTWGTYIGASSGCRRYIAVRSATETYFEKVG